MPNHPAKPEIDRQQREAFKRINGLTEKEMRELRAYCLGLGEHSTSIPVALK